MKFIDANCMIGKRNVCREGSPAAMEDYIEIMDRCGIEKAVAFHAAAKESDALTGNALLEKELFADRFISQWIVIPSIYNRFLSPAKLISAMKEKGVTSVRLYPGVYDHSLKRYVSGEMIDALAECNVPVFIDKSQLSWDELYDLCKDYPKAKFIICNTGYRCIMRLWPILRECPNLYVETSTFLMHNMVAGFCRDFGAERLIFGTGLPNSSATAAVSMILYASVSEEEKDLIGYGNISKLLGEVAL